MLDVANLKKNITEDPVLSLFSDEARNQGIKVYLIGGYVRDALLGKTPKDSDLMIDGAGFSEKIGRTIAAEFKTTLVRFEKFMVVFRITIEGKQYDFADLGDSDIRSDQLRRDFTINSLAIDLNSFSGTKKPELDDILDASTGIDDLQNKIIRINSSQVLADDPLRIIRIFRFERQLGFNIDNETFQSIPAYIDGLSRISGERIRDELFQIFKHSNTAETLEKMDQVGVLGRLFPEINELKGVEQNDFHHLDVYEHTLETIRKFEQVIQFIDPVTSPYKRQLTDLIQDVLVLDRPRYALIKLVLLFHDIAKPRTRETREDGRITFIGHDKLGVEIVEPHLDYLHLARREKAYINTMIVGHLRPGFLDPDISRFSRSIFRYFDRYGEWGIDLVLISIADRLSAQGPRVDEKVNARHDKIASILLDAYFNQNKILVRPPDLVNGNDLIQELNIPPGRQLGILLKVIKEAQACGDINSYDEAIDYARRFIKESDL